MRTINLKNKNSSFLYKKIVKMIKQNYKITKIGGKIKKQSLQIIKKANYFLIL